MAREYENSYDSYALACSAIDKRQKVQQVVKREKLALLAMTEEGKAVTLTGIHAATGAFLTSPPLDRARYLSFYPNTPKVGQLLSDIKQLRAELARLSSALG